MNQINVKHNDYLKTDFPNIQPVGHCIAKQVVIVLNSH